MSTRMLRRLNPHARSIITSENYSSNPTSIFSDMVTGLEREISIESVIVVIKRAMDDFDGSSKDRVSSDGWLAPRIHASLRLFRREAADLQIWEFLTLVIPEVREYVLWRWGGEDRQVRDLNRIYGSDRRHAVSRLWWVAELARNGPSYAPVHEAFEAGQDAINYLTDVDFAHNRTAALAYVRFFNETVDGSKRKKKESVNIARAFNHVLTTIVLDHLAPKAGIDLDAYTSWTQEEPNETIMFTQLPEGPNEPKISDAQIQKVVELLGSLDLKPGKDPIVSFDHIKVGQEYERPHLAEIWGFKSYHAISRGIVTPSSQPIIVLFVTEEKQDHLPQYDDKLVDDILYMEGESEHLNDKRIVEAKANDDAIHLFHRARHHSPFIYRGEIKLEKHKLMGNEPSKFVFKLTNGAK